MKKEIIKVKNLILGAVFCVSSPHQDYSLTRPRKGEIFSYSLSRKRMPKKSLHGKFLIVVALQTLPLVVGMPFRSLKSPSVSVAPYSLNVTAEHCLILMGLTAFSPSVVPWFRALPPWNDYSIAHLPLNVNTFFQKICWKFLPAPGHFISLNRGSAPHFRGALSTMRYFTSL